MNRLKRFLLVIILVVTGGLLAACNDNQTSTYKLPDLSEATIENFSNYISSPLVTIVHREEYHETIPIGQFIRYGNNLKAGDEVPAGTIVYIYFSKGPAPKPIVDTTPPQIIGAVDTEVPYASDFDLLYGIEVIDEVDGDLKDRLIIIVKLEGTNTPVEFTTWKENAVYIVTYHVMDRSGNEASAERTITIVPNEIDTRYTDNLKMDIDYYMGQSYINSGVGEVTLDRCVDGDTAYFRDIVTNQQIYFRFSGVNTPEVSGPNTTEQPWGKAASKFTCDKLTGAKKIVIEKESVDNYGRDLGWVWYSNDGNTFRLLNLEIIEEAYSRATSISGTKYEEIFFLAELKTMGTKKRIHGECDPDFDYGESGCPYLP